MPGTIATEENLVGSGNGQGVKAGAQYPLDLALAARFYVQFRRLRDRQPPRVCRAGGQAARAAARRANATMIGLDQ